MGYHQTMLQYGVSFSQPADQTWTFGSHDFQETMQRLLLVAHGLPETEAEKLEYDELSEKLRTELGLEIDRPNNPTNLGAWFIWLTGKTISVDEGAGKRVMDTELMIGLEERLRLEWAVKTLELFASQPGWMLQSVYC